MFLPSQDKKIAAIALAVFMVSFSLMMFFLGSTDRLEHTETNVLHSVMEQTEEIKVDGPGFITNPEGEFIYISESFCGLITTGCEEMMDGKIFEYIHTTELPDFVSAFTKLVGEKEKMESIGPFRVVAGNEEKLILFSAQPIIGEDEKVSTVIFVAKNLTEQIEKLHKKEKDKEDEKKSKWWEKIYPKIKEIDEEETKEGNKLLVEKIGYIENK